uniref:IS66 family transposase n=1 Tax=Lysinibacillus mangiferihumi TaxID=1130819 RepID=UPI0038996B16
MLTEQVRQLTKALYGSKSEKSKYQAPDGQGSMTIRFLTNLSTQKNKAQRRLLTLLP